MATCWLSQTGAIFVLLAICKPCIRFRWSLYQFQPKSSHLSSGILGLPSWCLVHPFSSQSTHAHCISISHIMTCFASCCLCIAHGWLCLPLLVVLAWVEPGDEYVHEEPVEYANEDQAFDNSENLAGKMTIPSISLLSLLASTRYIAMLDLPATVYHASLLPCQTSNHPFLVNHCLAMSPLLLSPSYSIASCRWRLEFVPCWNMFIVGI